MPENIYSPEYVKQLFNRMSASYERMNYITSFGFSLRWRRQFLQVIPVSYEPLTGLLDMLSGMGETWKLATRYLSNVVITALDFSPGMNERAFKKNHDQFNDEVKIVQEDLLQNSLPDGSFDVVISAFGLKTFNNRQVEILAQETYRLLKTGGRCSFVEVSKPTNKFMLFAYRLYLATMIPVLGRLLLADPLEYKMLWLYTERFNNARKAMQAFTEAGLKTTYQSYFFGCATGFTGIKQ